MRNTISVERLKEMPTYKELVSKKQTVKLEFLEKKSEREKISHAFQVYKNTGAIPTTVFGVNLALVNDLVADLQIDASHRMTSENL